MGGGGGGCTLGGCTLYKCQYRDVPLTWVGFSAILVHSCTTNLHIFTEFYIICVYWCMGWKLPIFPKFQWYWVLMGHNLIWRGILMGPVCENLQQHTSTKFQGEYPPPPLVAPLIFVYWWVGNCLFSQNFSDFGYSWVTNWYEEVYSWVLLWKSPVAHLLPNSRVSTPPPPSHAGSPTNFCILMGWKLSIFPKFQ